MSYCVKNSSTKWSKLIVFYVVTRGGETIGHGGELPEQRKIANLE